MNSQLSEGVPKEVRIKGILKAAAKGYHEVIKYLFELDPSLKTVELMTLIFQVAALKENPDSTGISQRCSNGCLGISWPIQIRFSTLS